MAFWSKVRNVDQLSPFGRDIFVSEYSYKVEPVLLVNNLLSRLFRDAYNVGFVNLEEDIERSVFSKAIYKENIYSLIEILLDSMGGATSFYVVDTENYQLMTGKVLEEIFLSSKRTVLGYTKLPYTLNSPELEKYKVPIDLSSIVPYWFLVYLMDTLLQVMGNLFSISKLSNKPFVSIDTKNTDIGALQEELDMKKEPIKEWLTTDTGKVAFLTNGDTVGFTSPSTIQSQKDIIETIYTQISQVLGLSKTYIQGSVVGGLGNNEGDTINQERVFRNIAETVYKPIFTYIQVIIYQYGKVVDVKPSSLMRDVEGLREVLLTLESTTLITEEEKKKILDRFIEGYL